MSRPPFALRTADTLPEDAESAALAGRVWRPELGGPAVVAVHGDEVVDISRAFHTLCDLCETPDGGPGERACVCGHDPNGC